MADNEIIGGVSIPIIADYSGLQAEFQGAQSEAAAAGARIAEAFGSGAASAGSSLDAFDEAVARAVASGSTLAEAIEQANASLASTAAPAQTATEQLTLFGEQVESIPFADANGQLNLFTDELEPFGAAAGNAAKSVGDLAEAEVAEGEAAAGAEKETASLGDKFTELAEALVITEALKEFGERALEVASEQEQLRISLTAMSGSAEAAEKQLQQINSFSFANALKIDDVERATQKLTAFGFTAEQIPALLQAAANSAAATGDSFDTAASKISNIALSGNAGARQLVALGVSVEDLGKQMGVTGDEAKEAFKNLDQSDRVDALTGALSKFQGTAAAVATSVGGQFVNLQNDLHNVFEEIGAALLPIMSEMIGILRDDVLPIIKDITEAFVELPAPVRDFITGMGLLVAAAAPVIAGIAGFSLAMAGLQTVLPIVTEMLATFGITVTSTGAAITATLALYGALAVSVFQLVSAYSALQDAQAGLDKQNKQNADSLQNLEILLRRQGVDISDLKAQYDQGKISQEQYLQGLHALSVEYNNLHPELFQHAQDVGKAHDSVSLYAAALQDAQKKLSDVTKAYDSGKASAADLIGVQNGLIAAQNAYNTAVANAQPEKFATAIKEFIPPVKELADAQQIAAASTDALKVKHDSLILNLGLANQALVDADNNYKAVAARGDDLTEATKRLLTATSNQQAAQKALTAELGDFNKTVEQQPKLSSNFDTATKSTMDMLHALQQLEPAVAAIDKPAATLEEDFKQLGLKIDEVTGQVETKSIAAFNNLGNHAELTLQGLEAAWGKISGAVNKLAQTDMPAAIAEYDKYIALLQQEGASQSQVTQAIAAKLQMEIAYAERSGTDATAAIIQLTNIQLAQEVAKDKATAFGQAYADVLGDISKGFQQIGKDIADNIVDGKSWSDIWHGFLKDLEKEILEQLIGIAFKALGDTIASTVSGLLHIGSTAVDAGKTAVDAATTATGAIADAGKTAASATTSAASTASSAIGSTASSALSAIGAIGSAISAITGIFGIFQNIQQENTLNAIEHNTRYLEILFEQSQQSIFWPMKANSDYTLSTLQDINVASNVMVATQQAWFPMLGDINVRLLSLGDMASTEDAIFSLEQQWLPVLGSINQTLAQAITAIQNISVASGSTGPGSRQGPLPSQPGGLTTSAVYNISVNISPSSVPPAADLSQLAGAIVQEIRANGGRI